jgi:hypothetical protein
MEEDRTTPDESTEREERIEAARDHRPDREPTKAEEEAADKFRADHAVDADEVARHEKEMGEIGAEVKGEGRID